MQRHNRYCTIADWISTIDFAPQQSDIISQRQEGTGIWFTTSVEFLRWLHNSNQTLFCPGIPGAGKTMISAIAVNHLQTHMQHGNIGVAYIFCNYKAQTEQTITNLASAILKQLFQGRPSGTEHVENLYSRHSARKTRPSFEEISIALQAVVSDYSKVYIVVDALDECADDNGCRSQLPSLLRKLQSKGHLSLMVTSRDIPDVVQRFSLSPILKVRASDLDIERFVAGQIQRLPRCVQHDETLQESIQDGICRAVDGM